MDRLMYLKDVVTLSLDPGRCVGCGTCVVVCPRTVFYLMDGKSVVENRDACMECGACAVNCPTRALNVNAGVGCAAAVINTAFGRSADGCCCVIESDENRC